MSSWLLCSMIYWCSYCAVPPYTYNMSILSSLLSFFFQGKGSFYDWSCDSMGPQFTNGEKALAHVFFALWNFFFPPVQKFIFRSRDSGTCIFTLLLFMCYSYSLDLTGMKGSMIGKQFQKFWGFWPQYKKPWTLRLGCAKKIFSLNIILFFKWWS